MRFTALLALYEQDEAAARQQVGQLERERADLLATLQAMQQALSRATITVGLHERELLFHYHLAEQRRITAQQQRITAQDQQIATARQALVEAHRKTMTIAKLRERDAREARQLADRRAQRRTDEFAARRVLSDQGR